MTRPNLPPLFLERLTTQLDADARARVVLALDAAPQLGLRAHPRCGVGAAVAAARGWAFEPLSWCPEGVLLSRTGTRHEAGMHAWHEGGAYYLQDPAAMGVVPMLDPQPGEWVLDLAAAPGGKSTHIEARLQGRGVLWSHDVDRQRAQSLMGNLERWGATQAVVTWGNPERLRPLAGMFDRVLLDAPCSGEGMFSKSAEARRQWSPALVAACARTQGQLLDLACDMLRPGGTLVYATCTLSTLENEDAIGGLLARRPDMLLADLPALGRFPTGALPGVHGVGVRWWPGIAAGNGHYAARLTRDATALEPATPPALARGGQSRATRSSARQTRTPHTAWREPTQAEAHTWLAFVEDTGIELGALSQHARVVRGDTLHLVPTALLAAAAAHAVGWQHAGVSLGTLHPARGGGARFTPHHALSRVIDRGPILDVALDDARVHAYLRGEAIAHPGWTGYGVLRADGVPLGWFKGTQGELNNLYPRGLRRDLDRVNRYEDWESFIP